MTIEGGSSRGLLGGERGGAEELERKRKTQNKGVQAEGNDITFNTANFGPILG